MLNFLPGFLVGLIATSLLILNILVWITPLMTLAFIKVLLPFTLVRKLLDPFLVGIAEMWISCNKGWMNLTQKVKWDVQGLGTLNPKGWYLVNSNHQSWVDILVLQYVLNRRIPLLKFFLKQELIRVPLMGMAWWALDFPFMKRYSKEYLDKHPEMKGKDIETTRKACEKFRLIPTSVMNFLEGTRFTETKHARQNSPYKHLLKPKAGGIAFAINAMGDQFDCLLNVTIVYPDGIPSFVDFLLGKMHKVTMRIEEVAIPEHFPKGDYTNDPAFREEFQNWVQTLWEEKDQQLDLLKNGQSTEVQKTA